MKRRLSMVLCVFALTAFIIEAGTYGAYIDYIPYPANPAEEQDVEPPLQEGDDRSAHTMTENSGESQENLTETESIAASPASMPETVTYISQEFLDLLEQLLSEGTAHEILPSMVVDQVLTEQEIEAYAADSKIASYKRIADAVGGTFLKVDGDNDGIEDLFAWIDDGGSVGNNSRVFMKGQEDGSFEITSDMYGITQEIAFVRYDGTVYLLETHFDYDRKIVDGFIVSLYQEGEVCETLLLNYVVETYEATIIYQEEGYESVAQKYAEEGVHGFWEGNVLSYKMGTAETEAEKTLEYYTDIDNDGVAERYRKLLFYPSSLSGIMSLNDILYEEGTEGKEGVSLLSAYSLEYEGIPLFFWVDSVGDKQVLFLLCYEGLNREMLYGYLIKDGQTAKVMEIDYTGILDFGYHIYTRGINYERNPWW